VVVVVVAVVEVFLELAIPTRCKKLTVVDVVAVV